MHGYAEKALGGAVSPIDHRRRLLVMTFCGNIFRMQPAEVIMTVIDRMDSLISTYQDALGNLQSTVNACIPRVGWSPVLQIDELTLPRIAEAQVRFDRARDKLNDLFQELDVPNCWM